MSKKNNNIYIKKPINHIKKINPKEKENEKNKKDKLKDKSNKENKDNNNNVNKTENDLVYKKKDIEEKISY